MENENMEVLIKKKKKKIIASISFCVILAICVSIFFSNYVSKDKIKIKQTKMLGILPTSLVINGNVTEELVGCVLVENEANCAVDIEIKGDFYDKNNYWLGEQIYSYTYAPNIKSGINTWWDIAKNGWFKQIAREEYTLLKCKKSKQKMIAVGFLDDNAIDNDITVVIDKVKDKVMLRNNTNHDIKGNIKLKEICYIGDTYIAQQHIFDIDELIPANKIIARDLFYFDNNDEYQKIKESSEKIETFLYGYAEKD